MRLDLGDFDVLTIGEHPCPRTPETPAIVDAFMKALLFMCFAPLNELPRCLSRGS